MRLNLFVVIVHVFVKFLFRFELEIIQQIFYQRYRREAVQQAHNQLENGRQIISMCVIVDTYQLNEAPNAE